MASIQKAVGMCEAYSWICGESKGKEGRELGGEETNSESQSQGHSLQDTLD